MACVNELSFSFHMPFLLLFALKKVKICSVYLHDNLREAFDVVPPFYKMNRCQGLEGKVFDEGDPTTCILFTFAPNSTGFVFFPWAMGCTSSRSMLTIL